mgnify:CR=1 FL=1
MDTTNSLAINGGLPVRSKPFPAYKVIGQAEKDAAIRVLDSGVLSRFLGAWHDDFFGGPEVQAFEAEWASLCGVKHAVSVNSCTSGLYAAVGAAGIGPGDEVIVSPYTMAASATAALIFQGVPVSGKDLTTDEGDHRCPYFWATGRYGPHHGFGRGVRLSSD